MTKKEKPYYYATTVENGVVVEHEGDEKYAVYLSEIRESHQRAKLWHKWLEKNVTNAYDNMGAVLPEIYAQYSDVCDEFMNGTRTQ